MPVLSKHQGATVTDRTPSKNNRSRERHGVTRKVGDAVHFERLSSSKGANERSDNSDQGHVLAATTHYLLDLRAASVGLSYDASPPLLWTTPLLVETKSKPPDRDEEALLSLQPAATLGTEIVDGWHIIKSYRFLDMNERSRNVPFPRGIVEMTQEQELLYGHLILHHVRNVD